MLAHLIELRRRFIYITCYFLAAFILLFYFSDTVFSFFLSPLLKYIQKEQLIATQLTSPVLTPLKLSMNIALLTTMPFILLQLWCFLVPGLYKKERRQIKYVLITSLLLFGLGLLFCFYIVLPFMFQFIIGSVPISIHFMPDIVYTVDFITHMLLIFALFFQLPLLCFIIVLLDLVTKRQLVAFRPYFIVGAFIIGMLLAPPDVISQTLLAIPLCLLYELGIILCGFITQRSYIQV